MSEEDKNNFLKEIRELIILIRGNPMDQNDKGLSGQVAKLSEDFAKMKDRDKMIYGGFLVLSFFAGAGATPVVEFVAKLFK